MCIYATAGTYMSDVPECDTVIEQALNRTIADTSRLSITFDSSTYSETGTAHLDTTYDYTPACLERQGFGAVSADTCGTLQQSLIASGRTASCSALGTVCSCRVGGDTPVTDSGTYQVDGSTIVFDSETTAGVYCVSGKTASVSTPTTSGLSGAMHLRQP
jgi:hypothetical protein